MADDSPILTADLEFVYNPLQDAVLKGNFETMVSLIENSHCDVSVVDQRGRNLLHIAAMQGHIKILNHLLSSELSALFLLQADRQSWTPLHWAAWMGHIETVNELITTHQLSPSIPDSKGRTILHFSALKGHTKLMSQLISGHKMDPTQTDVFGSSTFHHAIVSGNVETMNELICIHHFDPSHPIGGCGWTPLHIASMCGNHDLVKELIVTHKVDVISLDSRHRTALHYSVAFQQTSVVKETLAALKHFY